MIYTSYFGNIKALDTAHIKTISIARWSPRWYDGATMLEVAPTPNMIHKLDTETYLKRYAEIVAKLDANEILKKIENIANGQNVALLCYEKPNEFCHRHLLAAWLNKLTGTNIKEF